MEFDDDHFRDRLRIVDVIASQSPRTQTPVFSEVAGSARELPALLVWRRSMLTVGIGGGESKADAIAYFQTDPQIKLRSRVSELPSGETLVAEAGSVVEYRHDDGEPLLWRADLTRPN